jgi:hypothetical protein
MPEAPFFVPDWQPPVVREESRLLDPLLARIEPEAPPRVHPQ